MSSVRVPPAARAVTLLWAALVLVLVGAGVLLSRSAPEPAPAPAPETAGQAASTDVSERDERSVRETRATVRAARVLHAWDRARADAYAQGDGAALDRLYVPGSEAGRADRRILQAYAERGLVVRGMRMQVLGLEVLERSRDRLRLLVTDRLHRAVAVAGDGSRTRLPCDLPTTRVVTLVRATEGRGRLAVVEEAEGRGRLAVVEEAEGRGRLETPWLVSAVRPRSGR